MDKVLIVLAFASGVFAGTSQNEVNSRIVGGQDASDGDYPYMAAVKYEPNYPWCGGSIISKRTILTAAHCIYRTTPDRIVAVVGTNYLSSGGETYQAEKLIVHPEFDDKTVRNDLGLVIVDRDIEFTDKVQPIELANNRLGGDEEVRLTGWGRIGLNKPLSETLQYIDLITVDTEECIEKIGNMGTVFESSLCTFTKAGEGACNSDSGGPLVSEGQQQGIVSWGVQCSIGYPDVHTRVSFYYDWITENLV